MGQANHDMVLYAFKILSQYALDHYQADGEDGRVVSAINIITPVIEQYLNEG